MAFQIDVSAAPLKLRDGDIIISFWVLVNIRTVEKPAPEAQVQLTPYRSEADHDNNYDEIRFARDEVPRYIQSMAESLTPAQYVNVPNGTVYNRVQDILEKGNASAFWPYGAEVWAGFGVGNVVQDLPA